MRNAKKYFYIFIVLQVLLLIVIIAVNVIVDPYFHYHKPIEGISYRLYDERYTNDGIARNFDYNAFTTGTSMTQNFKPSELEKLFSVKAVKFPYSGGGYQEIAQNIDKALSKKDVTMLVWGLDYNGLRREYDWSAYDNYPDYLYDKNPWNDVYYTLNKEIIYHGTLNNLLMTLRGEESTTMDDYSAWSYNTGLEKILNDYPDIPLSCRGEAENMQESISPEDKEKVVGTIEKNIIPLLAKYPDTQFYLFFTPYSILYWDNLYVTGDTKAQLEAQRIATDMLVEYPNVKLYNFFDNFDLIRELRYYSDKEHYSAEVSSMILRWMKDEKYLVTKENKDEQLAGMTEFYLNYDYTSIYKQ